MKFSNEFYVLISFIFFTVCIRNFCIMGWDPADPRWFTAFLMMAVTAAACGLYIWQYFYTLAGNAGRSARRTRRVK
jgi:hypothetical protein